MTESSPDRLSTGVEGFDDVLCGGYLSGRNYMLRGPPGSGKTILGFHFLDAGLSNDETVLFVNFEEHLAGLIENADTLGFDTDEVNFLDLSPTADVFVDGGAYDVFEAAEVEQEPLHERIVDTVSDLEPDRVVVDPLTQLRHLSADNYQFRKQVVGFMRYLKSAGATVVFTVQNDTAHPTRDLEFMADGTVRLDVRTDVRSISVPKFRGSGTRSGDHTYRIADDGMHVYPALDPGDYERSFTTEQVPAGVPEIDSLLGGGVGRGTVSVISGPTGVGKTTLGTQFMSEAADRGERSVVYLFEENRATYLQRTEAIGIPVETMIDRGTLSIQEIDALERSPQEFAQMVRKDVEENDTRIVMIDGIAGYRLTLQGEADAVLKRLHALGRYLKNVGVTTVFVDETKSITGDFNATQENISYLADNIVFLRHLEVHGELRKAIGVLKKRTGNFERTLREFEITDEGIIVGEPLSELRGVLHGTPEVVD